MKNNKNPPAYIQLTFDFLEDEEVSLTFEELQEFREYERQFLTENNFI